jgi:hypothetical protein
MTQLEKRSPAEEALLDRLQRAAFGYFLETDDPRTGLTADTSRAGSPASIAVAGFALASYPAAVERGWITRADAAGRTLATLRFFWNSPQSDRPDAAGFRGFFYHFLDMQTGLRVWQSELSPIDTTFLLAGALTSSAYFSAKSAEEKEIRSLAQDLYDRVDWRWAQNGKDTVANGWKPECGFLNYGWEGYNEAALLYVLGLASRTHPLTSDSFEAWTTTYQWENIYGRDLLYSGPLFVHQFSHAWIDFKGIRDRFMREKRSDYFENSRRAVQIQSEYARRNPNEYEGYEENGWGFTAGDGPPARTQRIRGRERRFAGYAARGVPFGPDDGTLSPSAVIASLPFAPEIAWPAVHRLLERFPGIVRDGRFPSGFNPTSAGAGPEGWISEGSFGLDQGLVVLMLENHRTGLIWSLMRRCPAVRTGLRRAGFRGGWLAS